MRYQEIKTLLEYDRSKTIQALSNGILRAAQRDSYLQSRNLDDEQTVAAVIDAAESADPTPNEQYVQWIVRQFTKKGMKYEDLYKLEDHLETFVSTKGQHKRLGINSDINQYDWRSLTDTARKLSSTDVAEPDTADATSVEGAKILYNGPLGTLSVPETEAASCELGRGTEWCTSATKGNNMFDEYNKQGPLYIWHDKQKKTKYQFHFESGQVMNAQDEPVSDQEAQYLAKQNPVTSKLMKQNAIETINSYEEYLDYHNDDADQDDFLEPPDEEILDANIEIMLAALDDKSFASLNSTALNDSAQDVDLNNFKNAWFSELQKRPQLHSTLAKRQPYTIPLQYALVTGERAEDMEKQLLSARNNARALRVYADKVIGGEWPEAEPQLAKDPVEALLYAVYVKKNRFPEAEPLIKQNVRSWQQYKEKLGLEQ